MVSEIDLLRYPRRLPPLLKRAALLTLVDGDDPETARTKRLLTAVLWVSGPRLALAGEAGTSTVAPDFDDRSIGWA